MTVLGHTTTWGTHVGDRRTTGVKGWYAQFKTWLAARKAAQHDAKRATFEANWDAEREATRSNPMTRPMHADLIATAFRDLGV